MNYDVKKLESLRLSRLIKTLLMKVVITIGLVALVALTTWWLRSQPEKCSDFWKGVAATGFYTSLLFAAAWCFFLFSEILRRSIWKIVFFAVLFVWGSMSYFLWPVDLELKPERDEGQRQEQVQKSNPGLTDPQLVHKQTIGERQIEAPNRTLAAFFPSRGGFEDLGDRERCHYFLFHLAVVFFVAAVGFSIFGRGLFNRFRRRFFIPADSMNVFWGYTPAGALLAADILKTSDDRHAVFLLPEEIRFDDDEFKRVTHRLDEQDIIWICADEKSVNRSHLRGRNHYFLSESGHENVSMAQHFVESWKDAGRKMRGKPMLYVRVEADEDERLFLEWAERVKTVVTPIILREADIVARDFLSRHPMLDCPGVAVDPTAATVSGNLRVLLIGLGATGQSVLREMVCGSQFAGLDSFEVDVLERDPAVREAYALRHPEAMTQCGIRFVEDVSSAEGAGFEAFIRKNLRRYQRIVVCLPGDLVSVRVAMGIQNIADEFGVGPDPGVLFVHVSDPARHAYWGDVKDCRKPIPFGNLADVYRDAFINHDPIDCMARVLNGEWAKDKTDAGLIDVWNGITFADQQSSRASALGGRWHARVLGFDMVPNDDSRAGVTEGEFAASLADGRELMLARNEHLRWNAYHWMLGYSRWDMDTPRLEDLPANRMKANQLKFFGRHAALVPFDELPDVDYRIACALKPENRTRLSREDFVGDVDVDILGDGKRKASLQAYDIRFIRKIYANAQAAGMKLVRRG